MGLSNSEQASIDLALTISCSISIFASLSMISIFWYFKQLRTFFMKLVMNVVYFDLLNSIGLLLPINNDILCFIQSITIQIGSTTSLFFSGVIAYALYRAIVLRDEKIENKQKKLFIFGLSLPLALSILPFTTNSYGNA